MSKSNEEAFRAALDAACGEINEAARISTELFEGDTLRTVRRELARLMEIIDAKILINLPKKE